MTIQDAKQARPHCELIAELLDSRQPKTEREHAAVREIERLTTVLADRERYWKHVIRNYESTASSLRQVVAAQHQQITVMMPSCGKE